MYRNKRLIIELSILLLINIIFAICICNIHSNNLKDSQMSIMKNEINIIHNSEVDIDLLYSDYNIIKLVYSDGVLIEYPSAYLIKDKFDVSNDEYVIYKDYKGYYAYCNLDDTLYIKRINHSVLDTTNFTVMLLFILFVVYTLIVMLYVRNVKIRNSTYKDILNKIDKTSSNLNFESEYMESFQRIADNQSFSYISSEYNNIYKNAVIFVNSKTEVIYNNIIGEIFVVEKEDKKYLIDHEELNKSFQSSDIKNHINIMQISNEYYRYIVDVIDYRFEKYYAITIENITQELKQKNNQVSFFNQASHELRTPLTTIQGLVELLNMCELSPDDKNKSLEISLQECRRLELLISSIIDISKTSEMTDLISKIDISKLVNEHLESELETKNIILTTEISNNVFLLCNGIKVDMIISELIRNSCIHNIPNGDLYVSLSNDNGYIEMNITNTCREITKEELNKITEPMFRCKTTIDLEYPTTGMGLALIKGLCDAYKFQLEFYYENNELTTILKFYDISHIR